MTAVEDAVDERALESSTPDGVRTEEAGRTSIEETESRQSRKREREVSLEPGTPQAASTEADTTLSEHKDRRTPAKKNRVSVQLDATKEEEESGENAPSAMADVSCSPPHESKIRQISQGVEDLTWKNMARHSTPDLEHPDIEGQHEPMETEREESTQNEQPDKAEVPPLLQGENPPIVLDDAGVDEHAGEADPAEVPLDAQPVETSPAVAVTEAKPVEDAAPSTPPQREASPIIVSPLPDTSKPSRRGSDSSVEQEKGLKRKMGDRTVSESMVPQDVVKNGASKHTTTTKRPRDDPDEDENPRLTKRPTPPPDEKEKKSESSSQPSTKSTGEAKPPAAAPKLGGFAAYASSSSPFAAVKGPSLFAAKASPWASTSTSPFPSGPSSPKVGAGKLLSSSALFDRTLESTPPPAHTEPTLKRTGFEAFASVASPFASAAKRSKSPPPTSVFGTPHRSKSPARHAGRAANVNVNAFSAYATGGAHAFARRAGSGSATPALADGASGEASASASQGSEDEGSRERKEVKGGSDDEKERASAKEESFGARLRAQKDADEEEDESTKINLTEQEVHTGEEDEDTVYQVRGKLYALVNGNIWKERGTGQLKLNVRREDASGARLLMRKEAVYTVLLNVSLFRGMKCVIASDPRYIRFSVLGAGGATHYSIRVSSAKIATELLEEIQAHIPE